MACEPQLLTLQWGHSSPTNRSWKFTFLLFPPKKYCLPVSSRNNTHERGLWNVLWLKKTSADWVLASSVRKKAYQELKGLQLTVLNKYCLWFPSGLWIQVYILNCCCSSEIQIDTLGVHLEAGWFMTGCLSYSSSGSIVMSAVSSLTSSFLWSPVSQPMG